MPITAPAMLALHPAFDFTPVFLEPLGLGFEAIVVDTGDVYPPGRYDARRVLVPEARRTPHPEPAFLFGLRVPQPVSPEEEVKLVAATARTWTRPWLLPLEEPRYHDLPPLLIVLD